MLARWHRGFEELQGLEIEPLFEHALALLLEAARAQAGLGLVRHAADRSCEILAWQGVDRAEASAITQWFGAALETGGVVDGRWQLLPPPPALPRPWGEGACLLLRLEAAGEDQPIALLLSRQGRVAWRREEAEAVAFFREVAGQALARALRYRRAEQISCVDHLTGLFNLRYLEIVLVQEMARAARYAYDISVLFLDLDFFKHVNDRYGHLSGSEVLTETGRVLQGIVRKSDTVVRYGGDEFVLVLPRSGPKEALLVAERVRRAIEAHHFPGPAGAIRLTASVGVASYPHDARDLRTLLSLADRAQYRAKALSRNCVCAASLLAEDLGTGRP